MLLYLVRHAEAEVSASSDAARELTPKGRRQADRVGAFLVSHKIAPEIVLTSPVRRAEQTAMLLVQHLRKAEFMVAPFLACGMDPEDALRELGSYVRFRSVLLVGHQPDFGRLAACLLGMAGEEAIRVRKASLLALETASLRAGAGLLHALVPVRFM